MQPFELTQPDYTPTSVDDFIGSARDWAQLLAAPIQRARERQAALKVLINGPPGTGKSMLAKYIAHQLGCQRLSITKVSGAAVTTEMVDDWQRLTRSTDLFGLRLIQIEELDELARNKRAQVRMMELLDELRPGNAIIGTSNCRVDDFEKRFQRRFQPVCEVENVDAAEIAAFLERWCPASIARVIAADAKGCVAQALLDAQTYLDDQATRRKAARANLLRSSSGPRRLRATRLHHDAHAHGRARRSCPGRTRSRSASRAQLLQTLLQLTQPPTCLRPGLRLLPHPGQQPGARTQCLYRFHHNGGFLSVRPAGSWVHAGPCYQRETLPARTPVEGEVPKRLPESGALVTKFSATVGFLRHAASE